MKDLDAIEELARYALETGWDRRLPQNCLDLIKELRFWRRLAERRLSVKVYCPSCDYEVECEALEAYRYSENHPRCACGTLVQVRLMADSSKVTEA